MLPKFDMSKPKTMFWFLLERGRNEEKKKIDRKRKGIRWKREQKDRLAK